MLHSQESDFKVDRPDLRMFLRWWWLLLLPAVVATGVAYYVSESVIPLYSSRVKLQVERSAAPGLPSTSDLAASAGIAQGYVELLKTRPVYTEVSENLQVPYHSDFLATKLSISSRRNIIQIRASDPDSQMAALIANTTAETFIDLILARQVSQLAKFQEALREVGIDDDSRAQLMATQAASVGLISIIERAVPSPGPSNIHTERNVTLAAVLGILLGLFGITILEQFNKRIRSPDEVIAAIDVPILGLIPRNKTAKSDSPIVFDGDDSRWASPESYSFLRTNLEIVADNGLDKKIFLVTSRGTGVGKTTVSVNLASAIAQAGTSTILMDGDLRNPSVGDYFDSVNNESRSICQLVSEGKHLSDALIPTSIENLSVLAGGPSSTDPIRAIRSNEFRLGLKQLQEHADVIIIDSPPIREVPDGLLLAQLVDGVLCIADVRRDSRSDIQIMIETVRLTNAKILGIVLNKVESSWQKYPYSNKRYFTHDGQE